MPVQSINTSILCQLSFLFLEIWSLASTVVDCLQSVNLHEKSFTSAVCVRA